jgi:N-acetylmuramoyl-L-alanine amidase
MVNFIDDKSVFRTYIDRDSVCPVIVSLDCGHGGILKGVYQTKGKMFDHKDFVFYEGQFNRQIGKALAKKFWDNHISYTFTTISNHDEPLSQRIEYFNHFINTNKKHKHILLSLHANAAGVEEANGFEYFTSKGVTDSDYAANFYYPHMLNLGMRMRITAAKDNEYDKESDFYVIRKAEALGCMGLLFESGFYTNRAEATKMLTPEWQSVYVDALYKGTVDLLNKIKRDGTVR